MALLCNAICTYFAISTKGLSDEIIVLMFGIEELKAKEEVMSAQRSW